MLKEVTCQCGWQARGTDEEVIAQVTEHGRTVHGQQLSPEDVMAVWYDVAEETA